MSLVDLVGTGLWIPTLPHGYTNTGVLTANDALTLDADAEEGQLIGNVHIDGGGTKTFGTSGSSLSWLPGGSITFAVNSTLRVGVKKSATIDTANGPAARATIGTAAFDVYKDLVGGTDTITSTTWRTDAMASGTPFSVANGDPMALCWQLTTTAGTPNVKIRQGLTTSAMLFPASTLVTSGPTYTAQSHVPNCIITFDDGTLGWLTPSIAFSVADSASGSIGNTNIHGNVFQVPFPCKIDALAATFTSTTSAADFALDLYSTPLGTPALVEGLTHDANIMSVSNSARLIVREFATAHTLAMNTDYAIGVRQTTATAVNVQQRDVNTATHFKTAGMGAECYAAISTAGATFAQQNSGKRRYSVYARISALDDGVSSGSGGVTGGFMLGVG
jgi:hypothetical protein